MTCGVSNGPADLWIATRPSRTDKFGAGMPLPFVNASGDDCCPTLNADGTSMWFVSDRNGNNKIYRTTRASPDAAFDPPVIQERQDMTNGIQIIDPAVSFDSRSLVYSQEGMLMEMQRDCL